MRVAQLVQRTPYPGTLTIGCPSLLHALIAQRLSIAMLLCPKQQPMVIACVREVGTELLHQARIVEQDSPVIASLTPT